MAYNGTKFDTYQEGKLTVAVEYRETEDRYSFYIGDNLEELHYRAAKDLIRRGYY